MKVEGVTLALPELKPMIKKSVDIEVTARADEAMPAKQWAEAIEAVTSPTKYHFYAWSEQRALGDERLLSAYHQPVIRASA